MCGTLRSNRRNNPKDVISQKFKKGERTWRGQDGTVICKWKGKREVLTISNMHYPEMVEARNRNGKTSIKPKIVKDYSQNMSGMDRSDQMLSYYNAFRKTIMA